MRIILLPQIVRVYPLLEDEASYTLEAFSADVRVFESSIQVAGYEAWFWNRRSVAYQGEAYRVDCSNEWTPSDSAIKRGICRLANSNGKSPALSPELQYLLIQSHDPRYREHITNRIKVFGILFDEDTYDLQNVLGDFSNGTFTATSDVRMAGKSILLDDRVLGYDSRTDQLTCLDHDLKPLDMV